MDTRRYDAADLADAIAPEGSLAGIVQRILKREPADRAALAANRVLVLDQDPIGSPRDLIVSPPLQRQDNSEGFLASHALDDHLASMLARDGDTPPLDDLDLDD